MRTRIEIAVALCLALCAGAPAYAQTLPEVVRWVLRDNPEALAALSTLRATGEELNQARGGYFPQVEVRADTGRETNGTPTLRAVGVGDRTLHRDQAQVTVRQMLYDGGQVSSEVARQSSRVEAARSRVGETRESLALRITETYLDLLQVQRLLALAHDNVATHRDTLGKVRRRFEQGVGGRADIEQSEGRLAVAQATLVNREAALGDARTRYQRIVGSPPVEPVAPAEPEVPADRQQVLDRAGARNPAVHAAMSEVAAARAAATGARAPLYPKLDVELSSSRGRDVDGLTGITTESSALLVLRYNLFRGGADQARSREFLERQAGAEDALANTRRTVLEEASRAWIAFTAARDALGFLERHVTASASALKAYRAQFELGRRSLIDLLNAEGELFQARSNHASAQLDVLRARHRILASMGALAEHFGAPPAPAAP